MGFWFAYFFAWDGILGVLVGCTWSIFLYWDGVMSLVFGMVCLLHEMEHLIFGMNYLVISSQK